MTKKTKKPEKWWAEYNVQLFDHSLEAKLKDVLKDGIPCKKLGRIVKITVMVEEWR